MGIDWLLSPDGSLATLFAAAFLAATLVPFSSEAALFAVLKLHPELAWAAVLAATAGNTAGGMTTYALGRLVARRWPLLESGKRDEYKIRRALPHLQRWGPAATAFGWLPVVGDGLVLAAGWLRLGLLPVLAWQLLGRLARYWLVAQGAAL